MRRRFIMLLLVFALSFGVAHASPKRIVSLVPSLTENLFALGVGDRVVGVTSWCDFPAEAQTKTIVGDAMNLNVEILLSLEPDLVIGDYSLVQGHLDRLEELGIPFAAISPTTIEEIGQSFVDLGELVGAKAKGEELAQAMEARLTTLTENIDRPTKPRVFIEVWNEPLMTAGPGSFMDELIVLAGGENIAGDSPTPWPTFSEELVIERDPEVVILTNYNLLEALTRSAWQQTSAFKKERVYEVNSDLYARTTGRILDALEELISILDAVGQ